MKKILYLFCFSVALCASAQAQNNTSNFYQDLLVTDEVIAAENEDIAIENASKNVKTRVPAFLFFFIGFLSGNNHSLPQILSKKYLPNLAGSKKIVFHLLTSML